MGAWAKTYPYEARAGATGAPTGTTWVFSLPNKGSLRHVTLGTTAASLGPIMVEVACTVAFAGHGLINGSWVRGDVNLGHPTSWDGYLNLKLPGAGANTITCFNINSTLTAVPMALTVVGEEE